MAVPALHAPNAALLIDFDNVTLGVRSDLTKELRTLLNSDIIKGKVAVQRAYADWRRYPQYIVPLSESSIDLIFAPAFGTNKKNATDIRLAVECTTTSNRSRRLRVTCFDAMVRYSAGSRKMSTAAVTAPHPLCPRTTTSFRLSPR